MIILWIIIVDTKLLLEIFEFLWDVCFMICLKLVLEQGIYHRVGLKQLVVLLFCFFVVFVHMEVVQCDSYDQVSEFFHLKDMLFQPVWHHSLNNLFVLMIGDVIQRGPLEYQLLREEHYIGCLVVK